MGDDLAHDAQRPLSLQQMCFLVDRAAASCGHLIARASLFRDKHQLNCTMTPFGVRFMVSPSWLSELLTKRPQALE
jgi:hypothetical protein